MKALIAVYRELAGLFVDDGSLALAIVVVVLMAGTIAIFVPKAQLAAGAILVLGCFAALLANVVRAARR